MIGPLLTYFCILPGLIGAGRIDLLGVVALSRFFYYNPPDSPSNYITCNIFVTPGHLLVSGVKIKSYPGEGCQQLCAHGKTALMVPKNETNQKYISQLVHKLIIYWSTGRQPGWVLFESKLESKSTMVAKVSEAQWHNCHLTYPDR